MWIHISKYHTKKSVGNKNPYNVKSFHYLLETIELPDSQVIVHQSDFAHLHYFVTFPTKKKMFPFFVSFIKCEDIFTDFDPTQLEAHHYGPKSKWILNNASAHSSSNYIFFSCHSFLVCNYYKEVANIFENNSIEFVRVDSNFSFNNFSFTTSSSKTYEFNIVNNYSDIYEPIAFFYGNSDQKSNISEINESNYITIIAPESQYESMIKLSLELYDEIGFVNVRKTNESDTFQLWNPYERELSDLSLIHI